MLDEREALGRADRRGVAHLPKVRQNLVVRPTVRVAEDGRVASDRRQGMPVGSDRQSPFRGVPGDDRIGGDGESGSLVELDEEVDVLVAGIANCPLRTARPSLIRHSGVLIRRIEVSSRPAPSTRFASFETCSR